VLRSRKIDHGAVSGTQTSLYTQLGTTPTWAQMQQIETKALIAGGMSPADAASTVRSAIANLKSSGVTGAYRNPWGD
jgi:hypothetical protein